MDAETSGKLRAEFPKGTVGVLPKPYSKDSPKGYCKDCGSKHGLPAVHLDFVGHAAVTDRLLSVDPDWTWEPFATGQDGLPALDRQGNLWIRLTVGGVTRIGVGDGSSLKEMIGDAIRNAAMRFGVALSLWTKDELESGHAEEKPAQQPPAPAERTPNNDPDRDVRERLAAAKRRVAAVAPKDKDLKTWVPAALDARGLKGDNPADLIKLAEELEKQ